MFKNRLFFYHGIFLRFWRKKFCVKSAEITALSPAIFVPAGRYFFCAFGAKKLIINNIMN